MICSLRRVATILAAFGLAGLANAQPPLPPPDTPQPQPQDKTAPTQPGITVAEKGPIHEAFAQPGAEVRGKDMTAPKAPPAPIPEVPPNTKPEGANVKWIPGYWQWEQDKNDFIWVSGFYRNVPAGRDWQAGKWMEKDGKFIYTPGFWRPADMNSWRTDLPEPPKSVESGPSTTPSDPNGVWIPGNWEYRNNEFVWRAGYWAVPNGNMIWQPGQYVYTGSGYAYVPGYWDYPLENRGLLNAPVYVNPQVAQNPGWSYTPQYSLGMGYGNGYGNGGLFNSLYAGPGFNNYYYGNYNPWGYGGLGGSIGWGGGLGGYGGGLGGYGGGLGGYGGLGYGGYGLGLWSPSFGFGLGFGYPFYGAGYGGYYPWYYSGAGYYNPLWNHYKWLNRNNNAYAGNARAGFSNRALGLITPGNPLGTHPIMAGVGGAGAAAQSVMHSAPLVRPSGQVLANMHTQTMGAGALRAAGSIGVSPAIRSGGGVLIPGHANMGTIHPSAGMTTMHPGIIGNGYHAMPGISYPHVGSTPLYHNGLGGVHYGNVGGIHYGNVGGIHYGNVGGIHYGNVGGIHYGNVGGIHYGNVGGMHYGGFGGGHVGGGGMHVGGGGHGGHR